jgi:hypothetical protein
MRNFVKQHIELRLTNLNKLQDVFDQNVINVTKQWLPIRNEPVFSISCPTKMFINFFEYNFKKSFQN